MTKWRVFHILVLHSGIFLSVISAIHHYDVTTIYRLNQSDTIRCTDDKFLCSDGTCIDKSSVCNRFQNCADGSDEYNCNPGAFIDDEIICNDGTYVTDIRDCAGEQHCEDGTDELNCDSKYLSSNYGRITESKGATVEIRARTNALGLTFTISNVAITEDVGTDIASFPSDTEPFSWVIENWKESTESFLENGHFRYTTNSRNEVSFDQNQMTKTVFISEDQHDFIFVPKVASGSLIIKLSYREYYVGISPSAVNVYSCQYSYDNRYEFTNYDLPEVPSNHRCEATSHFPAQVESQLEWIPGHGYKFRIECCDNNLVIKSYYDSEWHEILSKYFDSCDQQDTFQLGLVNMKGYFFRLEKNVPYLKLEGEEGRLKSPALVPNFNKLCVAVISSITPNSEGVLEIYAEKLTSHESFPIGKIDSHQMKEENALGWTRRRFNVEIPEEFLNESIQIILSAKKSKQTHVFVHRVHGCSVYGEEDDVTLLRKTYVSDKNQLPAYTVVDNSPITMLDMKSCLHGGSYVSSSGSCNCPSGFTGKYCEKEALTKSCLHGGKYESVTDSCSCPIGFTGNYCEQGCGPNRFGDDCGGRCSGSLFACKHMILCRPDTNCECAPGIKGNFCDSDCAEGEYGAGCKETCGSCKNSPCNPYTGVCLQGCLSGFYPPFCKTTYKYLEIAPEVTSSTFTSLTVDIRLSPANLRGDGDPRFYQLQYRVQGETEWLELEPQNMPSRRSDSVLQSEHMNITNLLVGTTYEVRVVLIDKDGESYQKERVISAIGKTQCTVPSYVDYNLRLSQVQENGFQVDWDFEQKVSTWCVMIKFEVHVRDVSHWMVNSSSAEGPHTIVITDKLPGGTSYVKVRGVTERGAAAFSPVQAVTTTMSEPEAVRNAHVVSSGSTELTLEWDKPWKSAGSMEKYNVHYKCQRLLACRHVNCSSSSGKVTVTSSSVLLEGLLPHAQYLLTVITEVFEMGEETSLLAATNHTTAVTAPTSSPEPVTDCTNSSFVFHWSRPTDCKKFNGYLHGYWYELRLANDSSSDWLLEGRTEDTSVEFTGLTPHTKYEVKVYLITSAGWSKEQFLVDFATTTATVPGPVSNLTVYKRSRKELSLRWALPEHMYGELESFTVSHSKGGKVKRKVIPPSPCVAWPDSYCYTITGLKPDSIYTLGVQAKNNEVKEDGETSVVKATTREGGAPGPVVNLQLVNRTLTSLTISWQLPRMLNGMLRSFVLNIEESESYNSSECCQYYPLQEMLVTSEELFYMHEFAELKPASKYTISVSGKTTSLGPSATLSSAATPQEVIALPRPPDVTTVAVQHGSSVRLMVHPYVHSDLLRGYLLLVVPHSQDATVPQTGAHDQELARQLNNSVGSTFYIAGEILPEKFERSMLAMVGTGSRPRHGTLCDSEDPIPARGDYSVGLAIVMEYSGAYSVGYVQSSVFTVM